MGHVLEQIFEGVQKRWSWSRVPKSRGKVDPKTILPWGVIKCPRFEVRKRGFENVASKRGRFNLCTLTEGRAFLSKTFQWWFVCCVPPLMNPNPVVTLGPHRVKYAASRLEIGFSAVFWLPHRELQKCYYGRPGARSLGTSRPNSGFRSPLPSRPGPMGFGRTPCALTIHSESRHCGEVSPVPVHCKAVGSL
jgi:hypothetical protein